MVFYLPWDGVIPVFPSLVPPPHFPPNSLSACTRPRMGASVYVGVHVDIPVHTPATQSPVALTQQGITASR